MATTDLCGFDDARAAAAAAVRLAPAVAGQVAQDGRRIVVIGAGGWIGQSVLEMLHAALGPAAFRERVVCFGSSARTLRLTNGAGIKQAPLAGLSALPPQRSIVLHLAFLTKDKVASMAEAEYVAANRRISDTVFNRLDHIGTDRIFIASSGAAAFADDVDAAADLRLYGQLKRDDEERFAAWALAAEGRAAAIGRLYAVSGPFINKPQTYALADLILSVLAGHPAEVRAPMPVYRSYVAVREVVSFVMAHLLQQSAPPVIRFDTGGEPLELGMLAHAIESVLGGQAVRRPPVDASPNRYLGDHARWQSLLAEHQLSHLPIEQQIVETAAWLKATAALSDGA